MQSGVEQARGAIRVGHPDEPDDARQAHEEPKGRGSRPCPSARRQQADGDDEHAHGRAQNEPAEVGQARRCEAECRPREGTPFRAAEPFVQVDREQEAERQGGGVLDHAAGHPQRSPRRDRDGADEKHGERGSRSRIAGPRRGPGETIDRDGEQEREDRVGPPHRRDDGCARLCDERQEPGDCRLRVEQQRKIREREVAVAEDRADLDQVVGPVLADDHVGEERDLDARDQPEQEHRGQGGGSRPRVGPGGDSRGKVGADH
jgi:hypothetical protein